MKLSDEACRQARALIASRLGQDFPDRRQADLERALVQAARTSAIPSPEGYVTWLATLPDDHEEWRRVASHLTVGETYFFRDRACFEALEHHVLPSLISARRAEGILRLRLWSAGCSTGEEPYSLGILLDRLLPDRPDWAVTILATDINAEALERARRGRYREWSFRETVPWIRDRYFHRRGAETFEVDQEVRPMVTFAPLNLAEDGHPSVVTNTSAMDLILCRNVLMYFTREAQRATAARLQRALVTGGWLVVSAAEASAELFRPLAPVNFPGAIFYRKEAASDAHLRPPWHPETAVPESLGAFTFDNASGGSVARVAPAPSPPEENVEIQPEPSTLLQRTRALADRGHLEQARRLCAAVLSRDRLDPEAHLLMAAICQEQGEIPAALEALRRGLYLAPDSASAHFLLGSLLIRQGKAGRGRRSMETVTDLLSSAPPDKVVPGSDGLTAGRLLEMARAYLELRQ